MLGHMYPVFRVPGRKGRPHRRGARFSDRLADFRRGLRPFLLIAVLTRYVSLGSVCAGAAFPLTTFFFPAGDARMSGSAPCLPRSAAACSSSSTARTLRTAPPRRGAEIPLLTWRDRFENHILGSGGWGAALALLALENGHDVGLWSAFEKESEVLRQTRENPMLKGVPLPENLKFTAEISAAEDSNWSSWRRPPSRCATWRKTRSRPLAGHDRGLRLQGHREGHRLAPVRGHPRGDRGRLPHRGALRSLPCGGGGPRGSDGVRHRLARSRDGRDGAGHLRPQRFRVYTSDDIVGVELGAALKNIIALCCGIGDGLGLGDNTKAMLMTRGLTEIARLGVALGGRERTFAGLAGVGDLIVTCTSMHSRNRRAGILIGQGAAPEEGAVRQIGAVVEGYYAVVSARQLAERTGVEMPISRSGLSGALLRQGRKKRPAGASDPRQEARDRGQLDVK